MRLTVSRQIPTRLTIIVCVIVASILLTVHVYISFDTTPFNLTQWKLQHRHYTQLFRIHDPELKKYTDTEHTIPATKRYLFPVPHYSMGQIPREIGDCTNNGDSAMKKLSSTCGCAPLSAPVPGLGPVHPCCSPHLHRLLREVYAEVIAAGLPLILIGGPVIGWFRNRTLIPYDLDLDAGMPWEVWNTPHFDAVLKKLAKKGFCVWYVCLSLYVCAC